MWVVVLAMLSINQSRAIAEQPTAPQSAPVTATSPTVVEWLNQNVHLRQTTQAQSKPSSDSTPVGEIREGAEVKAIGLVAGKRWVEIELPDHSQAFVPREVIEYQSNAEVPEQVPHQAASATSAAPPSDSRGSALPADAPAHSSGIVPASATDTVRGKVSRVPNAATLVIGDQRVRLSGIDPGPTEVLAPFENWLRGQGDLACEPEAQTHRYRCFTSAGVDVAEAAILNGTGRVGEGAKPEYRDSETQARQAHRGLWQGP
jgi:endonuclease YncB( thermonuclease family)